MRVLYIRFKPRKPRRWYLWGLLLLAGGIMTGFSGGRYIEVLTHRYHPIYAVSTTEKAVALTFDISWGQEMAPKVLEILREHRITATFFLSGPWVKTHAVLAETIKKDGHEIASHGHKHVNYSQLSRDQLIENVQLAQASIRETLGVEVNLIRTPNGDFDDQTILTLQELGYQAIDWKIDSLDWKNPGVNIIIQRVLKRLEPGAIILMHASDSCKQTDLALPAIIRGITGQGFRFVPVSELLTMGDAHSKIR